MTKVGTIILHLDLNAVVYQGKKCREVHPRQRELHNKTQRLRKYKPVWKLTK